MKSITQLYVRMVLVRSLAFSVHGGIYVWYLQLHGLSPLEYNLVNAVYFIASFLLEVPTGHWADRYGRKLCCLIGYGAAAVGLAIYGLGTNFWEFAFAEFVIAVGFSCISGSFDAWAYEAASSAGENTVAMQRSVDRIRYIGQIVGTSAGGYAAHIWPPLAWHLSALGYAIVLVVAYRVMHGDSARSVVTKEMPTIREIYNLQHNNSALWSVALAGMLLSGITAIPNMLWQPILSDKGFVGPVASGAMLSASFALAWAATFIRRTPALTSFYGGVLVLGVIMLMLPFAPGYGALVLFFASQVPRAGLQPMISIMANHEMGNFPRATGLSIISAFGKIGGFVGLVVCGLLAEWSIAGAWIVVGFVAVLLSVITMRKLRTKRPQ